MKGQRWYRWESSQSFSIWEVAEIKFPARKTWYINYPLFITIITEHSKEIFKILPGEQDFPKVMNHTKRITGI